jgi:hypothetical protein
MGESMLAWPLASGLAVYGNGIGSAAGTQGAAPPAADCPVVAVKE